MTITANELKTKGVSILDNLLNKLDEVFISVRGKNRYVIVDMERYNYLRECELLQALEETREDIKNGNYDTKSVDEHIKELENAISN